jgi:outer membrane protein OmpA-like peptidoglycan-associated protein
MFRRLTQIISLSVALMFLGGCLAYTPVMGVAQTLVQGPISATANDQSLSTGKSCAYSVLGLVAWGDASINAAKNASQIKQVASVDFDTFNLLGISGSFCTVVSGTTTPPPPPPPPPAPKPAPPPPPPPPPPAPKVERTIILDDVLFEFDESTIKPQAAEILDRLVAFMNENPSSKVNLSGHTDSIGTEAYNLKLSDRRWMSVRDYVVKKGVDSSRVSGQGFGESKPIADNETAAGRAKNRRVEIKVN